jgi:dipeptidyl aminopeptidase/acylaminoacyl peptidase
VRCLTAQDGIYHSPSVSPDGSSVAFVGNPDPLTFPQNEKVGILPTAADGATASEIQWISTGLDRTFGSMSCSTAPVWESPSSVLAVADDRGGSHLYRLRVDGGDPELVVGGAVVVTSFDAAAGVVATTRTVVDRPAEVYVGDERRSDVAARFSAGLLGWERFTVPTTDGTGDIDCWVMLPPALDTSQRHPLLLNVHGGPFAQ